MVEISPEPFEDGFNRGYTTLKKLVEMGMKDVGFGMTVQDLNAKDLVALFLLDPCV